MLKLLLEKFLCCHKWKELKRITTTNTETKRVVGFKYVYVCEKCGKIKVLEV